MIKRILGFVVFFAVFLSVYFAMNWYVLTRLGGLLGVTFTSSFYIVLVALIVSFPLTSILERLIDGRIIRIFYIGSAVWLGMSFFLLCAFAIYELSRLFVKIDSFTAGAVILSAAIFLSAYSIINSFFVKIKTVDIKILNLKKKIKIVHLSDIHIGTIHNAGYLKKIVDKTNDLNPDMVMITGDLADGSGILTKQGTAPLNNIKAKTFFSLGNHEFYEGVDAVTKILSKTKIRVLRNEMVNYGGIQVIGIDFPDNVETKNISISDIKFDRKKPSVLMYHPPSRLKEANKAGVNLQLSGHTHNGQIWPFNYVVKLFFPYIKGLYHLKGTYLYVSPGTGTWGPPFRLWGRSEITLLNLVNR